MASVFGWVRTEDDHFLINKRDIHQARYEILKQTPREIEYRFIITTKDDSTYETEAALARDIRHAETTLEEWLALPEDSVPIIGTLIENGACRP